MIRMKGVRGSKDQGDDEGWQWSERAANGPASEFRGAGRLCSAEEGGGGGGVGGCEPRASVPLRSPVDRRWRKTERSSGAGE